jgi:hypothetical protein
MIRLFFLLAFVSFSGTLIGCGGPTTPTVLDQNVEKDPNLGDDYYDQEKYDEMLKGDPTPPS